MTEQNYQDTGNEGVNVIVNLVKLIQEKQMELNLKSIDDYDNMEVRSTPAVTISVDNIALSDMSLGRGNRNASVCSKMDINVMVYLYWNSLVLGSRNVEHLGRTVDMVKHFYANGHLYNLCKSEAMEVRSASIIARRLRSDMFLTSKIELNIPIRFCGARGI